MTVVIDPGGTQWSVYRRWWPFGDSPARGTIMSGDDLYGLVQLAMALPGLVIWPLWLVTRLCGAPWTIVVGRAGRQIATERVRGWTASKQRIADIAAGIVGGAAS